MRCIIGELALPLLWAAAAPAVGYAQDLERLPRSDRVRLAEAMRLADQLRGQVWPGWERTMMPVLLVSGSAEFLVGHPRPTGDFVPLGYDPLLERDVWTRPRQFSPTLLATFPAVGGVPTIVIGSAASTGKSSTGWVLTVLHEHFHQWQYSQQEYYARAARLDLARGDTTGQWMLDYSFPYGSDPVQRVVRRLSAALLRALEAPPPGRVEALKDVITARDDLRGRLTAVDYRYFEFQLWQEGVARFIEYAAARAAAELDDPSAEFRRLRDYQPYSAAARKALSQLRQELEQLDVGQQGRVAFYPIGAAMALLLEETRPDWKQAYTEQPFALAALLSARR